MKYDRLSQSTGLSAILTIPKNQIAEQIASMLGSLPVTDISIEELSIKDVIW